jgi:hypothetical protein
MCVCVCVHIYIYLFIYLLCTVYRKLLIRRLKPNFVASSTTVHPSSRYGLGG